MDEDSAQRLEQLLSGGYVLVKEEQIQKSRRANYWNLVAILSIAVLVVLGSFVAVDRISTGYKQRLAASQSTLEETQTALLKFQTDSQCRSVANYAASAALDHLAAVGFTLPFDKVAFEQAKDALAKADAERASVATNGCS